jgi:hypothetical protein
VKHEFKLSFSSSASSSSLDFVTKVALNEDNTRLQCLFDFASFLNHARIALLSLSGHLAVMEVPSFRVTAAWSSLQLQTGTFLRPLSAPIFPSTAVVDARGPALPDAFRSFSWWGSDHLAIQSFGGYFLVSALDSFQNILGPAFDQLEVPATLTRAQTTDAAKNLFRLMILEQSTIYTDSNGQQVPLFSTGSTAPEPSLLMRFKHFLLEGGLTSQPFNAEAKLQSQTMNLLVVQTVTPMEIISRKLKLEEFGTALELAKAHGVDTDIVLKHQWIVSRARFCPIEALSKVNDVLFIVGECLNYTPAKFENIRRLVELGLAKTQEESFVEKAKV